MSTCRAALSQRVLSTSIPHGEAVPSSSGAGTFPNRGFLPSRELDLGHREGATRTELAEKRLVGLLSRWP